MNTPDPFENDLRAWLSVVPPHEGRALTAVLAVITAKPRQRSRWLPRIPRPSVHQRRHSVPVAAAAVAALVVGILFASSASQNPTGPGGLLDPGLPLPAAFAGRVLCSVTDLHVGSTTLTQVGTDASPVGLSETRGSAYQLPVDHISDSRLDGNIVNYWDENEYDRGQTNVGSGTWRIETDDGAWEGTFYNLVLSGGTWATTTFPMYGEGEYDGLIAIWEIAYNDDARWPVVGRRRPLGVGGSPSVDHAFSRSSWSTWILRSPAGRASGRIRGGPSCT